VNVAVLEVQRVVAGRPLVVLHGAHPACMLLAGHPATRFLGGRWAIKSPFGPHPEVLLGSLPEPPCLPCMRAAAIALPRFMAVAGELRGHDPLAILSLRTLLALP